jgi:PAS domain S-box-containing protein
MAASAVRTSEIRYRRLFEAAKDGILILDVETGMIVDVNPFLIELLGYSREAFLNKKLWDVGSFKDVVANQATFLELQQQGYVRYEDIPLEAADGRRVEVEFVSNVYVEGDKRVIQCNVRDISERAQAEAALRESERALSESQRVARVGSWSLDFATDAMAWTPELYRVFGVSQDTFVPSVAAFLSLIHPDDRAAVEAWTVAGLAGKEPPPQEFRINLAGGGVRYIEARGTRVQDAENKPIRGIGIGQDITERKSLETSLLQARKMESIGRLAGGVAHDFNNLLTVINGYSALMLGNLRDGDPSRASLQEIHKAGERAARLTAQLLAFSRRQVLEPKVLDLNQLVAGMQSMLARLVGEDVVVHVLLKAEAAFVCADPTQLEQALMNLAVNSRDAMPRGGKLLIETAGVERDESYAQSHAEAHVGRFIMLAVSDNGEGMDEETRRNIFEPFFTTKEVGKGTGLGLSMVYGIVEQSGGSVEVYSEPGRGTTFKIYLPRVGPEAAQDERKEGGPALEGTETVLVVEDQAGVREYAATVLGSYGYQVLKAEDAGTALAICERERMSLVLTDVVMPGMSGRELGDQLQVRYPGMKVLYMSGYTDEAIARHGVLWDGAQFIQKPFSPTQLAAKVREVLGPPSR